MTSSNIKYEEQEIINTYSLKDRICELEIQLYDMLQTTEQHSKDFTQLLLQKKAINENLENKGIDVKKTIDSEIGKVLSELQKHFAHQKKENERLDLAIKSAKQENVNLNKDLNKLEARFFEIWNLVGLEVDYGDKMK